MVFLFIWVFLVSFVLLIYSRYARRFMVFFFFKHPQFLWFCFPLQTVAAEQDVSLSLHVASEVAFSVLFQGHNCR